MISLCIITFYILYQKHKRTDWLNMIDVCDRNPQGQPSWFPGKPSLGLLTNTIMVSTYPDMCDGVMESKIFIVYHSPGGGDGEGKESRN